MASVVAIVVCWLDVDGMLLSPTRVCRRSEAVQQWSFERERKGVGHRTLFFACARRVKVLSLQSTFPPSSPTSNQPWCALAAR